MEVEFIKSNMVFSYDNDNFGLDRLLNPGYDYNIIKMKAYDNVTYEAYKRSKKLNKLNEDTKI